MKKIIYGALFLAIVGISVLACKKENVATPNQTSVIKNNSSTAISKQKESLSNGLEKNNPLYPSDGIGKTFYNSLNYIDNFSDEIMDSTVFCPLEYKKTGIKDFSIEAKFLNRLEKFANDNNLAILSDDTLRKIYSHPIVNPQKELHDLVISGKVSSNFESFLVDLNSDLITENKNEDVILVTNRYAEKLSASSLSFKKGEKEALFIILSGIEHTAKYLINSGSSMLPVESVVNGIPCPVAEVGYAAAFVGLCLCTTPIGWVAGGIGYALGVWGVFESC